MIGPKKQAEIRRFKNAKVERIISVDSANEDQVSFMRLEFDNGMEITLENDTSGGGSGKAWYVNKTNATKQGPFIWE